MTRFEGYFANIGIFWNSYVKKSIHENLNLEICEDSEKTQSLVICYQKVQLKFRHYNLERTSGNVFHTAELAPIERNHPICYASSNTAVVAVTFVLVR